MVENQILVGAQLYNKAPKKGGWGTSLESKVFYARRIYQQEQLAEIQMNK